MRRSILFVAVGAVAVAAGTVAVATLAHRGRTAAFPERAIRVYAPGFSGPVTPLAAAARDVWAVSIGSGSVTELRASDGAVVQSLANPLGIGRGPVSLTAAGAHLWVAYGGPGSNGSVAEYSTRNGRRVWIATGPAYGFNNPNAIAVAGAHLWIADQGGNPGSGERGLVTELNVRNGSLVRTLSAGYGFDHPAAIAVAGSHIWVANSNGFATGYVGGGSLAELDAVTGKLERTVPAGGDLSSPVSIAVDGPDIWVASAGFVGTYDGYVTEFSATTGRLVRVVRDFLSPIAVVADGAHVWVLDGGGTGSVTELNARDGSVVWTVPGGRRDHLDHPCAMAVEKSQVWLGNCGNGHDQPGKGSITVLPAG